MEWKAAIRQFAQFRNRVESEGRMLPIPPQIADEAYLHAEKSRLKRLSESRRARGIEPVRSETRLWVLEPGERETDGRIRAVLRRHVQMTYRLGSSHYCEEKIEHERVLLASDRGNWILLQIEPEDENARWITPAAPAAERTEGAQPIEPEYGAWMNKQAGGAFGSGGLWQEHLRDLPPFDSRARYDRQNAAAYADRWWNSHNPSYLRFDVDCSNYVSQCIFAGRAPMNYTGKRDSGWWYRGKSGNRELWSYSWAVANALKNYLSSSRAGLRAQTVDSPRLLRLGDVISYDWDDSGRFGHSTVVTAMASDGMPLVNAHTVSSRHRYWDYRDSYAWTERTQYRFFHIADEF